MVFRSDFIHGRDTSLLILLTLTTQTDRLPEGEPGRRGREFNGHQAGRHNQKSHLFFFLWMSNASVGYCPRHFALESCGLKMKLLTTECHTHTHTHSLKTAGKKTPEIHCECERVTPLGSLHPGLSSQKENASRYRNKILFQAHFGCFPVEEINQMPLITQMIEIQLFPRIM